MNQAARYQEFSKLGELCEWAADIVYFRVGATCFIIHGAQSGEIPAMFLSKLRHASSILSAVVRKHLASSQLPMNKEFKFVKLGIIALLASLSCLLVECPDGLSTQALHMIIIFVASMVGIMLEVCEPCSLLFLAICVASLTGTVEINQCFSGFSNTIPWLIFTALSLSSVVTKTALGMRLAYLFVKLFGKNMTGLSYSIIVTEFLAAPVIPSNTARGANIGFPLVTSIARYVSSHTKGVQEKSIGAYLSILYAYSNAVCSAIFITAMISNAIIVEILANDGIQMSWLSWCSFMLMPGICILIVLPFILRLLFSFKTPSLDGLRAQAAAHYKSMGKLSQQEKCILSVFALMLSMWIFSEMLGVPIIVTVLLGIVAFVMLGLLSIKEAFSSYSTLNPVIMLGILISFVNCLVSSGAIAWFSGVISNNLSGRGIDIAYYMLTIIYFFTHYFFSGEGGRIIALYATFLTTGLSLGIAPMKLGMTLAFFSSTSDVLAHYTCPASLTMFSTGYVSAGKWMLAGLVNALIIMGIWFGYVGLRYF
jgi:DASS family divalent anion:Na+ symporter